MNGVEEEPRMRKPTKVYGSAWIYEEIPEISKICPNPEWNCGNWMMFFDNAMVDQKWEQAVNLYRQGKLNGIHALKVSTMRENCKNTDNSFQVIMFCCGPSDDQYLMLEIGNNLLNYIDYKNPDGAMYFKADSQSFLRKPRPTGNKNNFKYRITVPKY